MPKTFLFWITVILFGLFLIFAFANILTSQEYYFLFFSINASSTIAILFSGFVGFLIGFFVMLYSYEIRHLKELEQAAEAPPTPITATSPTPTQSTVATAAPSQPNPNPSKKTLAPEQTDNFSEDDEVLG